MRLKGWRSWATLSGTTRPAVMTKRTILKTAAGVLLLVVSIAVLESLAQEFEGGRQRRRGDVYYRTTPEWQLDPKFTNDCFTFVRIKYQSTRNASSSAWWTDFP